MGERILAPAKWLLNIKAVRSPGNLASLGRRGRRSGWAPRPHAAPAHCGTGLCAACQETAAYQDISEPRGKERMADIFTRNDQFGLDS